ncbi:hypothetical protein KBB49_02885 [Candidatus Saccharibacteria bacterium]|jgi:hypothetical protein|nr:hypothetical protein [Candidatus Saccharibacteria bacterium]
MINDNPNDRAYAEALNKAFDSIDNLSPNEIQAKFYEINDNFYPNYQRGNQTHSLMLQTIHTGIIFDELNPNFPGSDKQEALKHYRQITNDCLAGNFYPSYLELNGNYTNGNQGFSWNIRAVDGLLVINCGDEFIADTLRQIAETVSPSGSNETALISLQKALPNQIGNHRLANSEIQEYLD